LVESQIVPLHPVFAGVLEIKRAVTIRVKCFFEEIFSTPR
jgi:hypothetical protein